MKKIFLLSICLFSTFTFFANISANQAINIAGKQRMLSQKIAKVYLLQAYGANMNSIKSELNISKIIFERNLETLNVNATKLFSPAVKRALSKERSTWNSFKSIVNRPINSSIQVERILELSNQLLKDCHQVVVAIKKENIDSSNYSTNSKLLDIIDTSGKQRMLSQRLCLYFVAKKLALKNRTKNFSADNTLLATYKELDTTLVKLLNSEVNTMNVEEAIGQTMLTFENLRSKKSDFLDGSASLNIVYSTTNLLTKNYDNLTSKYSDLKVSNDGSLVSFN